jgi:outer membrane protein TolC
LSFRAWLAAGLLAALGLAAALPAQEPTPVVQASTPAVPVLELAGVLHWAAANAANLQLKQSELRAAEASQREAASRFMPSLNTNLSASYMFNPPKGLSIEAGSLGLAPSTGRYPTGLPADDVVLMPDTEPTYFKAGAELSQPLFTWGKLLAAAEIARSQVEAASSSVAKISRENRRDLQKAYFGAILARQGAQVLAEMESMYSRIVADRELSFQQGTVNRQDVLEAKSKLAGLVYQRTKTGQAYDSTLSGIAFLAGLPDTAWQPAADFPDADPDLSDQAAFLAAARENSPDRPIVQAQLAQAAKARDIAAASGWLHPDLGLSVKLDITGQRVPFTPNWTDKWDWNLIVSLGTQMNLFDGGAQLAKTGQAEERVRQATLGLSMIDQSLPTQVQRALEAARSGAAALADKQAAMEFAAERDKNAQAAFANDMATREDSQGARIAWLMARLDLLNARFQQLSALADLEYLTRLDLVPQ